MIRFDRILFPVDFSSASKAMVPYVREMARLCIAQVSVLHSFNLVQGYNLAGHLDPTGESYPSPIPYTPSVKRLREQQEESLHAFGREQFPDIKCRVIMEDGDPASVIHRVAQRNGIDLIMMPTSGCGTFRRLLLGSVTAKVLHDVSCAVFTSAHEADAKFVPRVAFRVIVCAINLNEEAEAVLDIADSFTQACEARLSILHMTHRHLDSHRAHTAELALDVLKRKSGSAGVLHVLHEGVTKGIRRAAIDESADLVIVGRGHARGRIPGLWSDLYRIVRESPCPVLSVCSQRPITPGKRPCPAVYTGESPRPGFPNHAESPTAKPAWRIGE
jgi:nucleotide-binding universal stress UspA family protein